MHQIIENTDWKEGYYQRCQTRYDGIIGSYKKYAELNKMSLSDVLTYFGETQESLYEEARYDESCIEIYQYIIDKENLLPSCDELKDMKQEYVEEYGYDTIAEFISDNGEQYLTECIYELIGSNYVYENIHHN